MKNNILFTAAISLLTLNSSFAQTSDAKKTTNHDKTVMERVMVIGSSDNIENIAGSAHFIDKENLDNHNYTDVNSVLKQVPGVNIQQEDGFGNRPNIGFRGGRVDRSSDITLMEDGILISPAPYSAPSAYYFPRISRMESVEVRKGSSTIEFGPRTTSGALNLISSSTPDKAIFEAMAGYGSFDTETAKIRQGNKINNFSYVIDMGHEKSKGFKTIDIAGGETGYSIQDVMGKFKLTSDDDAEIYQSIELKLGYTKEDSDETYLGLTDTDFNNDPNRRYAASQHDNMTAQHKQYQLRHFVDFNSFDVTTTLYRNEFARNWYKLNSNVTDNSDQTGLKVRANNRDYFSQGIQSIVGTEIQTGELDHKLKFSARFHQDEESRFQRDDTYALSNGFMNLTNYGVDGAAGNRKVSAEAVALYVSDDIKYKNLTVTPGLRYEQIRLERNDINSPSGNNINHVHAYVPGLGAVYKFNDNYSSFASVHKGFSPPTPGKQDVKNEESTNYELGLRHKTANSRSEIVGFFNNYSNLIAECNVSAGCTGTDGDQFNGGQVDVKGVELSTTYDIAKRLNMHKYKVPITLNYTYTDARFKSSFTSGFSEWEDVNAGDQMPYVAKNQLFASIGLVSPKWELHFNAKYIDKMRAVAGSGKTPNDEAIGQNLIFDFSSEFEIIERLRLFVNVENLTDEQYRVSRRPLNSSRPGKPLAIMSGIKYKF